MSDIFKKLSKVDLIRIVEKNIDNLNDNGGSPYIYIEDSIDFIYNALSDGYHKGFYDNLKKDKVSVDKRALLKDEIDSSEETFDHMVNMLDIDDKGLNFVVKKSDILDCVKDAFNSGLLNALYLNNHKEKDEEIEARFGEKFIGSTVVLLEVLERDESSTLIAGDRGIVTAIGKNKNCQKLYVNWGDDKDLGDSKGIHPILVSIDNFSIVKILKLEEDNIAACDHKEALSTFYRPPPP